MPTNRRRVVRSKNPMDLTDGERCLLETGECSPARGKEWPDKSSWLRPYMLASPAGKDELKALWLRYRAEIMADWKKRGRRGRPWAATEFDQDLDNNKNVK